MLEPVPIVTSLRPTIAPSNLSSVQTPFLASCLSPDVATSEDAWAEESNRGELTAKVRGRGQKN